MFITHCQARFRALGKTIPCADMLASVIADGRLFSDLAVQMHCGDGVPFNMLGWHNDGPNSLLHFSLTLAGQRCLFMVCVVRVFCVLRPKSMTSHASRPHALDGLFCAHDNCRGVETCNGV